MKSINDQITEINNGRIPTTTKHKINPTIERISCVAADFFFDIKTMCAEFTQEESEQSHYKLAF
jgi:hypothetical protein